MNAPGYLKGQCHDDITGSGQFCAELSRYLVPLHIHKILL